MSRPASGRSTQNAFTRFVVTGVTRFVGALLSRDAHVAGVHPRDVRDSSVISPRPMMCQ